MLAVCSIFNSANGQSDERITVAGGLYTSVYRYQQGEPMTNRQLRDMISNRASDLGAQIRAAGAMEGFGVVLDLAGGGLMGYAIGYYIATPPKQSGPISLPREPFNWTVFGIGAGTALMGVVVDVAGKTARRRAVEEYNMRLSPTASRIRMRHRPQFSVSASGVALWF